MKVLYIDEVNKKFVLYNLVTLGSNRSDITEEDVLALTHSLTYSFIHHSPQILSEGDYDKVVLEEQKKRIVVAEGEE